MTNSRYTSPRSYGVYELPVSAKATRLYRFGNHPVRQQELEREFGSCLLVNLYPQREAAKAEADALNSKQGTPALGE
ncbi:MAG: hypothetical protein QM599_03255 [Pseudoxanthomonas sp.]